MSELTDSQNQIESLSSEVQTNVSELQSSIKSLAKFLSNACGGIDIHCSGENATFVECAPTGDRTYGHFTFCNSQLYVASRSTDDDEHDSQRAAEDRGAYTLCAIEDVNEQWLLALVESNSLPSLLNAIGEQMSLRRDAFAGAAKIVKQIIASPSESITTTFQRVSSQLGYHAVVDQWHRANSRLNTDSKSAITLASTLLESVCKHLLDDMNEQIPSDQSIQPLVKATAKALGLDPAEQNEPELRGMCGGLASVVQNVGLLRTKGGDAHGRGPNQTELSPMHARFSVNAAGNVATFLMERWQAKKSENARV